METKPIMEAGVKPEIEEQWQWQALHILEQAKANGKLLPAVQNKLKELAGAEVRPAEAQPEVKKAPVVDAEVNKQTPDGILREWAKTLPTDITSESVREMHSSAKELAKKFDRLEALQLSPNVIRFVWKMNTIPGDICFYQFEYKYNAKEGKGKWEFENVGATYHRWSDMKDRNGLLIVLNEMLEQKRKK